jgi:hypothetical protein
MTGRRLSIVRTSLLSSIGDAVFLTFEAVGLVTVEALGVYILSVAIFEVLGGWAGVRFLTIGTCFFAATICRDPLAIDGGCSVHGTYFVGFVVAVVVGLALKFL